MDEVCAALRSSEHAAVIEVIHRLGGCIFGGFLRDFVRGKPARDLDAVVKECHKLDLDDELQLKLGYILPDECSSDDEEYEYTHASRVPLHIVFDDFSENVRLGPCCYPDYDVNLLAFDSNGLFNWMDLSDPTLIIQQILLNQAAPLQPDDERKSKMKASGFKIVDPVKLSVTTKSTYGFIQNQLDETLAKTKQSQAELEVLKRQIEESERQIEETKRQIEQSKIQRVNAQIPKKRKTQ